MLNNQRVDETRRNSPSVWQEMLLTFRSFCRFLKNLRTAGRGVSFFVGSQGICWFVAAGLLVCIDVDGPTDFLITMAYDGLVMGTIFGNLIYLYWISFKNHFEWPCYNILQSYFSHWHYSKCFCSDANCLSDAVSQPCFNTPTNEAVDVEWCWRVP